MVVGEYCMISAILLIDTFSKPSSTKSFIEASRIIFLISSFCFSFLSAIPTAIVYNANIINGVKFSKISGGFNEEIKPKSINPASKTPFPTNK